MCSQTDPNLHWDRHSNPLLDKPTDGYRTEGCFGMCELLGRNLQLSHGGPISLSQYIASPSQHITLSSRYVGVRNTSQPCPSV